MNIGDAVKEEVKFLLGRLSHFDLLALSVRKLTITVAAMFLGTVLGAIAKNRFATAFEAAMPLIYFVLLFVVIMSWLTEGRIRLHYEIAKNRLQQIGQKIGDNTLEESQDFFPTVSMSVGWRQMLSRQFVMCLVRPEQTLIYVGVIVLATLGVFVTLWL